MDLLKQIDRFHKTRTGYTVFAVIELVLVYIFASISIDTGNLWYYAITILLFIGAVQNIVRIFWHPTFSRAKNQPNK